MALFTPSDSLVVPRDPRELTNDWNLINATASPGSTVSGSMPFSVIAGGGLWAAARNELAHVKDDDVRLFRALRSGALAGARPLIVYRNDATLPPFPLDGSGHQITDYGQIPFGDLATFDDGSCFYQPVIDAYVVADADLNDTSITIAFRYGGPLRAGESFSLNHPQQGWRLYEIASVTINGAGHSVVKFSPWLRDKIVAGSPVEFDQPRCTMKMSDGKAMDLNFATYPFTRPTATFIEYFFPQI